MCRVEETHLRDWERAIILSLPIYRTTWTRYMKCASKWLHLMWAIAKAWRTIIAIKWSHSGENDIDKTVTAFILCNFPCDTLFINLFIIILLLICKIEVLQSQLPHTRMGRCMWHSKFQMAGLEQLWAMGWTQNGSIQLPVNAMNNCNSHFPRRKSILCGNEITATPSPSDELSRWRKIGKSSSSFAWHWPNLSALPHAMEIENVCNELSQVNCDAKPQE